MTQRLTTARKGSFSTDVAKFAVNTLARHEKLRRGVVLKLFSAVVDDTPVDTGRLRANWRCSVEQPNLNPIDAEDKSGDLAKKEIEANLGDGTGKDVKVYLTNNLPYVWPIEFGGHSKQKSPQGMVRRNVLRFQRLVSERLQNKGGV
jgi:hypothetical protein